MKKNYTSPVVEVNAFDFEDVVMTSGGGNVTPPAPGNPSVGAGGAAISEFKTAAAATGIVVEW